MERKEFEKRMAVLWKSTKKDLDKALNETAHLVKKGEEYIKDISEIGKEKLELLTASLRRERLYYDLGKTVANRKKISDKKTQAMLKKIKGLDLRIRGNKKKKK